MRIIYDHQIFMLQDYGGISRYFIELMRAQNRLETAPHREVVAPIYRNRLLREATDIPRHGRYLATPPYLGRVYRSTAGILARAKMRHLEPAILHQTYFWEGARSRSYAKGPIVITVYDMIHEKFPQFFPAGDPTARAKAEAVLNADHVICISEQTKQDLINIQGVAPNKVSVTYLSHSLPAEAPTSPEPFSFEKPYVLYVGARDGYKNFSSLLSAYAAQPRLYRNFDLKCLGGGRFTEDELAVIGKIPDGQSKVVALGGGDQLLVALYRNAAAFVYPSLYEGFGIPPLEAMATACPVVCGNGGSLLEVVGAAAATCDVGNPEALGAELEKVLFDPSFSASLKQAGLARADLFSWDRCAMETQKIYEALL